MVKYTFLAAIVFSLTTTAHSANFPGVEWEFISPKQAELDEAKLEQARDYALTGEGSGIITRHGKAVMSWGDLEQRYDLKSTSKSIGVTALGVAILDGKVSLNDRAADLHPAIGVPPESNADTGWLDEITLWHLATHTAGFEKPGGYEPLVFEPGTEWRYSDGGPNWLAECITLQYRQDIQELLFERVFTPIGVTRDDLRWRNNAYRPHEIEGIPRREFGSGVHANVKAMARIGLLYLRQGKWNDERLLPEAFVLAAAAQSGLHGLPVHQPENYSAASNHYGLLWWNNADGTLPDLPRDAYWSWGLYDSLIVVIPSLDIVVARTGRSWSRHEGADHYDVLAPFFIPIVEAAGWRPDPNSSPDNPGDSAHSSAAPYPPSELIASIQWAPEDEIIRLARGSDNWPITWGDDGHLYSAYGDGWGFEPFVEEKLSLGLVRVEADPPSIRGYNIRSPSAEQIGDGARGKKASGMLMVDGVLYMWVRNAGNSQLAWSSDRGESWEWSEWRFEESFGAPSFLQFGPNYAGARDEYVYIYSHDADSAYEAADRMALARVPKDRVVERESYEFFAGFDQSGAPQWSYQKNERDGVFHHVAGCYRSGISYNPALKRYFWSQVLPSDRYVHYGGDRRDIRFEGGFGVYEAPEPWGPWSTVYFTEEWDVGPGESSRFPVKWIQDDGLVMHLLFSGDDYFAVRKANLTLREQ